MEFELNETQFGAVLDFLDQGIDQIETQDRPDLWGMTRVEHQNWLETAKEARTELLEQWRKQKV